MYYRLIARLGASRASTVTYLVPLFGVAWAWMLIGEPLTWAMAIAGAMILGSVAISQRGARCVSAREARAGAGLLERPPLSRIVNFIDRQSVVLGKRVSVRVDLGGGLIIIYINN